MSAACSLADGAADGSVGRSHVRSRAAAACLALALCASAATTARADEGGVSFWIPGFFGSLAATPQQPGWSVTSMLYNTNVSATGNAALAREITVGRFNPAVDVSVNASVRSNFTAEIVIPSYTFATPVLGGQASVFLLGLAAVNDTHLNATATGTVGPIPVARTIDLQQTTFGNGDLIPMFTLRWNAGVNNYMVYMTGDIPVGLYSSTNLSNIGLGHGAIDGGVGYTYFDEKAGHEFSVVTGLTGNFENTATNYTSGIDWHLDWGASQFMTKQFQVGLVGYFYQQLTSDSGCAPIICPFESRVIGIGPQIGYLFPVGDMQGYLNLKGYGEFDNNARPDGFNVWLTLSLSPKAPAATASKSPMLTK